jgi:nucleoredoxin
VMEGLAAALEDGKGNAVDPESLRGKVVAFYFSAHWCGGCVRFTPVLNALYEEINEEGNKLEIIFVTSDRSAKEMQSYMDSAHGPWLRLKYGSDLRDALKKKCAHMAQPHITILLLHWSARSLLR